METCGATTRDGGTCDNKAGKGTDHVGAGKCHLHGGATPVKHGLYSKHSKNRLSDKIQRLKENEDELLDLTNTVALQQAIILELMDGRERLDTETAEALNRVAESLSRTRKRLATIEDGIDVNIRDIETLVERVVHVVQNETDEATANRVGQKLLGGSSDGLD